MRDKNMANILIFNVKKKVRNGTVRYHVRSRVYGYDFTRSFKEKGEAFKDSSIVLWIVEPAACKVLASLGVGDSVRRPGQIFISSGAAGLGGEIFAVPGPRWWVLDVPRVNVPLT